GQEMDDHYFGVIKPRVKAFMNDLDEELWKLGVLAKTEHNEVAPSQHELAPIYTTANLATDQNQLMMEVMKKVAQKHGLACLLHEKPFASVNGSGKHNNWSLITDKGENLLNPGKEPEKNYRFMLFLCAVIVATDEHSDLLRLTAASAGNDNRLGGNEAPPAIVSMFIGDNMINLLTTVAAGIDAEHSSRRDMETGVKILPHFKQDTSDRNRTSPMAFTGNKFEFRMLGSSFSIAGPNIILNTIVADTLHQFAERLRRADDPNREIVSIIADTMKDHGRILFNGNNYSDEWVAEAARRGLPHFTSTADVIPLFTSPKNIELFKRHGIFTETEIRSRCEILLENYSKTLNIEAETMVEMASRDILPAITAYVGSLTDTALKKRQLSPSLSTVTEETLMTLLSDLATSLYRDVEKLRSLLSSAQNGHSSVEKALFYKDQILPVMASIRASADKAEEHVAASYWPIPTYSKLLFSLD
ncbi:MAG: glutamine synthetase type III, partial [Eubacteriales bacterium]|nr:glutamine synthetase type III [Eubacteriales bacterium]